MPPMPAQAPGVNSAMLASMRESQADHSSGAALPANPDSPASDARGLVGGDMQSSIGEISGAVGDMGLGGNLDDAPRMIFGKAFEDNMFDQVGDGTLVGPGGNIGEATGEFRKIGFTGDTSLTSATSPAIGVNAKVPTLHSGQGGAAPAA